MTRSDILPGAPLTSKDALPVALVVERSPVVAADVTDVIRTVHGDAHVELRRDLDSARDLILAAPRLDFAVIPTTQTLQAEPELLASMRKRGIALIVAGERIRDTLAGYPRAEILPSPFTERMLEAAVRRISGAV